MKNYFFLGLISSVMIFNSCSSNDDNDTNESVEKKILLSKITTLYYGDPTNSQTTVTTFEYNNHGALIKVVADGRTAIFEYKDEKPVKVNYYNANQTLEYYTAFTYNGDKLTNIKAIYTNPNFNRNSTYTYNTNGQLASSTLCQSENCSNPSTTLYTYNGDNISTETNEAGGTIGIYNNTKKEISYDNKLNPYTNINKYLRIMMEGAGNLSKNNYTTEKLSYKDSNGNWIQNQTLTYSMQYNSSQLAIQVIGKEASGANFIQYNYEYIIQ